MKAVVISKMGGPEELVLSNVPEPAPGPDDLLVEVDAAGVNYIDIYHRSGSYDMALPFVPGLEGAGTVVEVGSNVDGFVSGDRVGWTDVMGSYAERIVVPSSRAVPVPEGIETTTAAAVLLQGLTAHFLASDTFPLSSGDRCLIHAGAGGVGLLLTQIAKLRRGRGVHHSRQRGEGRAEQGRRCGPRDRLHRQRLQDGSRGDRRAQLDRRGLRRGGCFHLRAGTGSDPTPWNDGLVRQRLGTATRDLTLVLAAKGSLYLTRPTMRHYLGDRSELLRRCSDLFQWIRDGQAAGPYRSRVPARAGGRCTPGAGGTGHHRQGDPQSALARIACSRIDGDDGVGHDVWGLEMRLPHRHHFDLHVGDGLEDEVNGLPGHVTFLTPHVERRGSDLIEL